jgi:drug/metabolite transporter (DMT)-like permease
MGNFFGGYSASALRSILVLAILVPIAVAFRKLEPLNWKKNWQYFIGMVMASLLVWGPLYYAILHAGIGITTAVNYTSYGIGMFVFGRLFGKERFTKDKWISSLLGIGGLFLIFAPTVAKIGWLALAGAVVSGLSVAANGVIAKKMPYKATQSTIFLWIASVVANIIMVLVVSEPRPVIGLHAEWGYLVLFALASVVASWTFVAGLKLIDSGTAGILGLLEIVFGVIFGVIFFHERLRSIVILGILIVIVAAAIPYIKDYSSKSVPPGI